MGATGEELKEGKGVQKLANLKKSCLDLCFSPPSNTPPGGAADRFAHSAGPGMVPQRVEAVGSGFDGLMQSSK